MNEQLDKILNSKIKKLQEKLDATDLKELGKIRRLERGIQFIQEAQHLIKLADEYLEDPKCTRCGEAIIDEPHYDCMEELKKIQEEEQRGDMEVMSCEN